MTDPITATTGMDAKKRPDAPPLSPAMALLQKWRNADHEDTIRLTRDDVVTLIEETHAQLADAQAAQAMVVERAAAKADRGHGTYCRARGRDPEKYVSAFYLMAREIRALADIDGLAEVAKLRAERDALKKKLISPDPYEDTAHPDDHAVNRFAAVMKGKLAAKRLQGRGGWQEPEVPNGYLSRMLHEHVDKGDPVDVANLAMMIHQRGERIAPQNEGASCKAIDDAEAERDRIAAANAVLKAKVAGLVEATKPFDAVGGTLFSKNWNANDIVFDGGPMRSDCLFFEDFLNLRAALATQEAGNG